MAYFLQQTINGLTLGSIYGLIALGYTMVYGIIGMINFAHGEVYMVGAFVSIMAFTALGLLGISWAPLAILLVLAISVVFTSAFGWTIERLAYRPLRGSPRLAPLISAIGVSIFLQNYVQLFQGAGLRSLQPVLSGDFVLMDENGFQVHLSLIQIVVMVVSAVLMVLLTFVVQSTPLGRAQRACEQDRKMAALLGIDVDRTISLTFVIGAALAAVAGVLYLSYYGVVSFADGFVPGVKAFTAAVLGGIGSLPGAVLGGLLIGLIEVLWSTYVSTDYKDVAAFSILAITLIFMPTGLLGRPEIEKV